MDLGANKSHNKTIGVNGWFVCVLGEGFNLQRPQFRLLFWCELMKRGPNIKLLLL